MLLAIYSLLVALALTGAVGTKIIKSSFSVGAFLIVFAGTMSALFWCYVSNRYKDILIINITWDALYCLVYALAIYFFVDNKITPTVIVGSILILAGMIIIHL